MNHIDLNRLYEATSEDLLFAIGVMQIDGGLAPHVQILYEDWTRQQLELVRESFKGGLNLVIGDLKHGTHDLYLSTNAKIALRARNDGNTAVLRAPAWDARLSGVEEHVLRLFESNRKQHGGFMPQVQTLEWGFQCSVRDPTGRTIMSPIFKTSHYQAG